MVSRDFQRSIDLAELLVAAGISGASSSASMACNSDQTQDLLHDLPKFPGNIRVLRFWSQSNGGLILTYTQTQLRRYPVL